MGQPVIFESQPELMGYSTVPGGRVVEDYSWQSRIAVDLGKLVAARPANTYTEIQLTDGGGWTPINAAFPLFMAMWQAQEAGIAQHVAGSA